MTPDPKLEYLGRLRLNNDISGHTKAVTSVALHQHGPIAVSGSNDSTIRVWNYEDEEKV